MVFDGITSHAAATPEKKQADLHVKLIEGISLAAIAVFAVLAWQLHEVGETVRSHDKIVERAIQLGHANALVVERHLARLEEREPSKEARDFRLQTPESELLRITDPK